VRFVAELEDSAEFVLAAVKRPQAGGSAAPYLARAKSGAGLRPTKKSKSFRPALH